MGTREYCVSRSLMARSSEPQEASLSQAGSTTSSARTLLRRVVNVDDDELRRRLEKVHAEYQADDTDFSSRQSMASRGWKCRSRKKGIQIYTKRFAARPDIATAPHAEGRQTAAQSRSLEVVSVGELSSSVEALSVPLRSPRESDFNAIVRELFGSSIIYSSVIHVASTRMNSALPSSETNGRSTLSKEEGFLLVKATTFVHSRLLSKKNEHIRHTELYRPTSTGGFCIVYCSLPVHEVSETYSPDRELSQLHPFSAWFAVEPLTPHVPGGSPRLRFVFHARFDQEAHDRSCSVKVAAARLLLIAKGLYRLPKLAAVVTSRFATSASVLDIIGAQKAGNVAPQNTRCIVCTRSLFRRCMPRRRRRCELCDYTVCVACCSPQNVSIDSRRVTPLLVCGLCRQGIARDDFTGSVTAVDIVESSARGADQPVELGGFV